MMRILTKVIVQKFYEQNAVFFLFIFFLMFGIVESSQLVYYHISLITGMLSSSGLLAIVCGCWLLYTLKCLQFVLSKLDLPDHEFLYGMALLDGVRQFKLLFIVTCLLYLPVIIYTLVILGIAIHLHLFLSGIFVLTFQISMVTAVSAIVQKKINSTHQFKFSLKLPVVRLNFPRPLPFFYLRYLTSQFATVLIITKVFSLMALGVFLAIPLDHYESRMVMLGMSFALVAHAVIVFELRKFEDRYLSFMKNLPLKILQRFITLVIVYVILLLPEAIYLAVHNIRIVDVSGMLVAGTGFLVFTHCYLYSGVLNMDQHVQRILFLFLITFIITLWHAYLAEAAVLWIGAFLIYRRRFYLYEAGE